MRVPFINLRSQYETIQQEIDEAVKAVFTTSQFIGGDFVKKFESEFAHLFSQKHCIATGNGTDALFTILKSLGIGLGDEVITPAFSCIASAETISLTGAHIVFADVDPQYYTLDLDDLKKKISNKTKAVIVVHLYGQAAPISELKKICDSHNILIIEDCAQAHLTEENGKRVGTFGIASAFSFYPTKNLGAYGDAGAILTNDTSLAEKMRRFTNHGALQKDDHTIEGSNSRLDALQAAILSVKLTHLKSWNTRRAKIAEMYTALLHNISGLTTPSIRESTKHTFHIYSIRSTMRNELKEFLASHGVETMIHYPVGLPFTVPFQHKKYCPTDFPVTSRLQNELLSLPVYPELTDQEVTHVASCIRDFFQPK